MPGITILDPCDDRDCAAALDYALALEGPAYVRVVRDPCPAVFDRRRPDDVAPPVILREGSDVLLLSSGPTLHLALAAAKLLAADGVASPAVAHVTRIKPLSAEAVSLARRFRHVVTLENHCVLGGFGSAVCEALAAFGAPRVHRLGLPDAHADCGSQDELLDVAGLTPQKIADAVGAALAGARRRYEYD